ncbi:MAG TPA: FemAB family XrtA/PEP-CTERM system-associated protein, partial [Gemmatimonadales bacterium]|nr:FemAB family XrtA/PEP-CTERM system-associated protein [Gemmatimonadales bacterium]
PELFTGTPAEWDGFAAAQSGFTHFHRFGWKPLIEQVFGHECLYLAVRDDLPSLAAVLPLVRLKSLLFGHYLVSMPFLNYGGPLGSGPAIRLLTAEAVSRAGQTGVRLLELRSRASQPLELPVSHRKITVVLDLPDNAATLLSSFPAKLRSQVRRPGKEGVTVRFGPDQVRPFYDVFSRHMRDLGTPTLPQRFFDAVAERFPEAWFGCAWLGARSIAGGVAFRWGREVEITWASSLGAYRRIAPNMLLYWAFMERAISEGITLFNFGRCTPGSGTHRFKRQWGSRDEPLWWYQWAREGAGPAATPSPDQSQYAWGPRLWKYLPLGLSRRLGPLIVRSIP